MPSEGSMSGRNKFGYSGLRQRRGRFLGQKEISAELRHLFKDKRNLERYLRTGDLRLAKQRAPAAMAELNDKIERARGQRLTSLDIEYAARDYREQRIRLRES
jgi:hypothetical protein